MKFHLNFGFQFVVLCFSLGLYTPAYSSIIVDEIVDTEKVCDHSNGTLTFTATGTIPVSYSIDSRLIFQSRNFFVGLESNDYLNIDGTIFTKVPIVQIPRKALPSIDLFHEWVKCANHVNIDFVPFSSGIPPDNYIWLAPQGYYTIEDLSDIFPRDYTLMVQDKIEYSLDIYVFGHDFVFTFDTDFLIQVECGQKADCKERADTKPESIFFILNTPSCLLGNVKGLIVYGDPMNEEVHVFHICNRWELSVNEEYNLQTCDESISRDGSLDNEQNDMEVLTYYADSKSVSDKELKYVRNSALFK